MAGDWLPIRLDLPDHPVVVRLAARIDKTVPQSAIDQALGVILRYLMWGNRHAPPVTVESRHSVTSLPADSLNAMFKCEGLFETLEASGWAKQDDDGFVVLQNWANMNSKSSKERMLASRRKADERSRKGHADVTVARDKNVTREENKRRVQENKQQHAAPLNAQNGSGSDNGSLTPEQQQSVDVLMRKKITERKAVEMSESYDLSRIREVCDAAARLNKGPGWIVKALEDGYDLTEAKSAKREMDESDYEFWESLRDVPIKDRDPDWMPYIRVRGGKVVDLEKVELAWDQVKFSPTDPWAEIRVPETGSIKVSGKNATHPMARAWHHRVFG